MTTKPRDIDIFIDQCAFTRSVYLHQQALFDSTGADRKRLWATANIFFTDLNVILNEHVILQVCKITDPARDVRKNTSLTVDWLLEHYALAHDARLCLIRDRLKAFGAKLRPARNKIISHLDRSAVLAGVNLGAVSQAEWNEFWIDLQDFICVMHERLTDGEPFYLNGIAMLSDVDGLFKALKHAALFDELLSDPNKAIADRCAELAFRE